MKPNEAAAKALPGMMTQYASYPGAEGYYPCFYANDVVYATYDRPYTLQIIHPEAREKTFPLIVFVQGSAWYKQNVYMNLPQLCAIAAHGFVVAMVEYRDTSTAGFPAQVEDAKAALRFMRANAEKYHVNPKKAGVFGDSSGGHVALMVGMTPGLYRNDICPEQSDAVDAVVDFYGVTDILALGDYNDILDHTAADSPEGLLLGGRPAERAEAAKKASPAQIVSKDIDLPPILVVHGDADGVVHTTQSISLVEALQAANKNVTFVKVIGADHGTGVWGRERLQMVADFFTANLKNTVE